MFRLIVLAVLTTATLASVRYDNFKVFEVFGKTPEDVTAINELENTSPLTLDLWRYAGPDLPAHISVSPADQEAFRRKLTEMGLEFKIVVENVQHQIDEVDRQMNAIPYAARDVSNTYYTYENNIEFLERLQSEHRDQMFLGTMGKSRYGRELLYVQLTSDGGPTGNPEDSTKPVIWIESTTHAREWIANACILNLIQWMLKNNEPGSEAYDMLDKYDWFIAPIQNPDGYVRSFEGNRMWRKTRDSGSCFEYQGQGNGVDPNRNWAYAWGSGQTNRCAQDYQGPSSLSEPSTKAMADTMWRTPRHLRKAFLSLHSYSQMILTPYGHDRYATVPNYDEQLRVAKAAAQAILDNSGTNFRVGKPGEILYNAPGGAYDFAYGELEFTYSLTYELHPASSNPGFQLPPDRIAASFSDFLASIKAIAKELR